MALQVPSTAGFLAVDTTTAKNISLPLTSSRPGRILTFKDRTGNASTNPVTITTSGSDTFQDGTTSYSLNQPFQSVTFVARAGLWLLQNEVPKTYFTSTLAGLGQTYVSTSSLVSTTLSLQRSDFISSPNLAGHVSTTLLNTTLQSTTAGLGQIYISTGAAITQTNLTSTIQGLGTLSYLSSAQLISTAASYANYFTSLSASFSSVTASNVFASTLIVNNLQIGTGLGWVNIGPLQTVALSTNQVQAGTVYATSNLVGSVSTPFNAIQFYGLFGQYNNTVLAEVSTGVGTQELLLFKGSSTSDRIRLQTTGSIVFEPGSSARLWASSITSNATPAMVIDTNSNVGIKTGTTAGIALDVAGLARFQQLSTLNIQISSINGQSFGGPINSSIIGLGSSGYLSSTQLQSTVAGLGQIYISTGGAMTQTNVTSTVVGLGSVGYISTSQLQSTVAGLGQNYVSTASLVSTTQAINSAFSSFSTLLGLSTSISTLTSQYIYGTQGFISSLTVNALFIGSNSGYINFGDIVATSVSTTQINTSILYASSIQALQISGATTVLNLVSTTAGLQRGYQTAGFLSTATLQSTVAGLGQNYISTSQLTSTTTGIYTYISSFIDPTELTSTVVGLGTTGYVSTMGLLSTASGLASYITSFIDPVELASTVTGLGSASFVSSLQLTLNITSTVAGLGSIGYVSSTQLQSTVTGIGSAGYISSLQLRSTVEGLGSANYISSTQLTSTVTGLGTANYISSLQLTSTTTGTNAYIQYYVSTAIEAAPVYYSGAELYMNYTVSSPTVSTGYQQLGFSNLIGTNAIVPFTVPSNTSNNLVAGFQTSDPLPPFAATGLWTMTLFAQASGNNVFLYTSFYTKSPLDDSETLIATSSNSPFIVQQTKVSLDLVADFPLTNISTGHSLVAKIFANNSANQNRTLTTYYENGNYSHVHTTLGLIIPTGTFTSTVIGLGSSGYISSLQLLSTVGGLGSANYISSTQLRSTVAGLGQIYISSGAAITQTNLTSTIQGLGSFGYVSTASLVSTTLGLQTSGFLSTATLQSTVAGLGQNYVSTTSLRSTVIGINSAFSTFSTLISLSTSISTLTTQYLYGTQGFISSLTVNSLFLGSNSGFLDLGDIVATSISTTQINTTILYASSIWATQISGATTILNLVSTTAGLQYSYQTAGFVSAPNLIGHVSTAFLNTTLQSTVAGLGQNYVSTASLISTTAYLLSNAGGTTLASTIVGLGTFGYVSTASLVSTTAYLLSNAGGTTLASTIVGLGTFGYVSTASLQSTVTGLGSAGYVSTAQLTSTTTGIYTYISSFIDPTELTSTVIGLGTTGYVSTMGLLSTASGLASYITSFIDPVELASTVTGLGSASFISSLQLQLNITSTVAGLGSANYVSTASLVSTVQNLQYGYQTAGFISAPNLIGIVSTTLLNTTLQSTVAGLGQSYVSTASLVSTTTGLQIGYQTAGFISAPNLIGHVSTAFLNTTLQSTTAGLGQIYVSTVAAAVNQSNITSTVKGLGTLGYISSFSTFSTLIGLSTSISSLTTQYIYGTQAFLSSLTVNSLFLGSNSGFLDMGDIVATSLSTVLLNANSSYVNNTYLGSSSTPFTAIQFYGLFGQYNNTVLAEVSTGIGTQELLLFKGSSTSDRIRLQTTGSIVFEPGSSSRLWPSSITSNVTPAMVIDINSNVGIKTGTTAGITLDVAGLARFQQVSTQNIQLSTINGLSFGAPINSSIIGLGSSGYVSTASLVSTTLGLQTSGFLSTATLQSTVAGLGLTYVSTASLVSTTLGLQTGYQTSGFLSTATLQSTVAGLGQNYISTASLTSTVVGINSAFSTFSTLLGLSTSISTLTAQYLYGTQGFISSLTVNALFIGSNSGYINFGDIVATSVSTIQINTSILYASSIQATQISGATTILNLVSTTAGLQRGYQTAGFLSTPTLQSTVAGLGLTYVSTASLVSTTAGLQYNYQTAGFLSTPTLQSTVAGLGQTYVSTASLISTVGGLQYSYQTAGFLSSPNLLSTTTGIYTYISSFVDPTELTSTVIGLGTTGYVSTMGLLSTASGLASYITSFIDPVELASTVTGLGSASFVSTLQLTLNITSTVAGLGQTYVSTASLVSTVQNLQYSYQTAGFVSAPNLLGHVSTTLLNTTLQSTVAGLGLTYVSTASLISTTAGIQYSYQISGFLSTPTLQSTVAGLGQNYVSTASLISTTAGLQYNYQTAGFISAPNLIGHISTAFLNTTLQSTTAGLGQIYVSTVAAAVNQSNITSTVQGLGTLGYISSFSTFSTLLGLSTSISSLRTQYIYGTQGYISSLIVDNIFFGSNSGFLDLGDLVATSVSTTLINTNVIYASSVQAFQISGATTMLNLVSTTAGLQYAYQTAGFLSTATLQSTVAGLGQNYVSTIQLTSTTIGIYNYVSTFTDTPELLSTVAGLGQNYVSTAQLTSTTLGIYNYVSTFIDPPELLSTVAGLGQNYVSTIQLTSTTRGIYNYVSTFIDPPELLSTVTGLGSAGYISTASLVSTTLSFQTAGFISAPNLLGLVSTTLLNTTIQSTVAGLGQTYVSTASLVSSILSLQTAGFISAPNLIGHVSTTLLNTTLQSTAQGFGTLGYLSSFSSFSTLLGLSTSISSLRSQYIYGTQGYISSLTVDNIFFGSNAGFIAFGDIIATSVSTTLINTNVIYASSVQAFQISGATTTLNLVSTVQGLQYAYQTAGFISAPNLLGHVSTTLLNTTIQSTVAGLGQTYVSTASLTSTVQSLQTAGFLSTATLQSTVAGLGQIYVSTAQLTSTTTGIYTYISSFVDPTELTSTVIGLGTTGYVSTMGLLSTASGLASYITSFIDPVELASTVTGLGSASFVSTLQLTLNITSTVAGLGSAGYVSTTSLISTVGGLQYAYQTAGFVSAPNLIGHVSTTLLNTTLQSTVVGLGQNYVSTASLLSTTAGLQYAYQTAGFISAPNLINHVSTAFLNTTLQSTTAGLGQIYVSTVAAAVNQSNITSTVQGLGTLGYISSFSTFSTLIGLSTSISSLRTQYIYGTQGYISSLIVDNIFFGSNSGFLDLGDLIATSISTTQINATIVYASSIQAFQISGATTTLNLVSTTAGLQYAYQTAGFVSAPNLIGHVSTTLLNTTLQSTVIGLGLTYVSTASLISTTLGLQTSGFISSANLTSTVGGLGNVYISTVRSTFLTLSTGYLTASTLNFYDPINMNSTNTLNVRSTLLYFNTYVVGGARVAQGQVFTF